MKVATDKHTRDRQEIDKRQTDIKTKMETQADNASQVPTTDRETDIIHVSIDNDTKTDRQILKVAISLRELVCKCRACFPPDPLTT